jgi:hypothetical protein
MSSDPTARPTTQEPLPALVARLSQHINGLRRQGNPVAVLPVAIAAADTTEQRVAESPTGNEETHAALMAVKRFTYNVAADCWPGWSTTSPPIDRPELESALHLAERSFQLVTTLGLGGIQQGTAQWLVGAFHLALGDHAGAVGLFTDARKNYAAANAPGLVLLTEGYLAITRQLSAGSDDSDLSRVCAELRAGNFEDAEEWIVQLRTALEVFS